MSYAFSDVLRTEWNDEVVKYLASKFNSINPRIIVLSKSVFINATLAKFDNVSFILNAANECLELSFAKVDTDKMEPVINAILNWDAFTEHSSRFYVKVDKDTSRSILFDSGSRQSPNQFKKYFHRYETEILHLTKAETPDDVLKGIEKEPKKDLGTYKGSKLTQMPGLMITDEEHQETVNKTINGVIEKLGKET